MTHCSLGHQYHLSQYYLSISYKLIVFFFFNGQLEHLSVAPLLSLDKEVREISVGEL